ncbi:hypothetical protein GIB67_013688 [Kingdonia uniflora]|uniref:Alpha-1,3-mannosyl-glycoprotein 2-beta-N-acetylglucosaminyltransferase n=1 Tax=Kingdonia uniflora TaxID=39325 RepID=A0A7J7NQQ8_9MAGN|nr:hypothetical protein GIB67_013688 [Kingdonia uniflora]
MRRSVLDLFAPLTESDCDETWRAAILGYREQIHSDRTQNARERIVSLEEKKKSQDQECGQLRALVHDLERKDGPNENVKHKALSYNQITYMQHLDFGTVQIERPGELIAYYKIASHYKWALDGLFYKHKFTRAIILKDAMEISPDFFDYFEAAATLMDKDRTIMAVSSWNDNGQKQFVHDPKGLYSSDVDKSYMG